MGTEKTWRSGMMLLLCEDLFLWDGVVESGQYYMKFKLKPLIAYPVHAVLLKLISFRLIYAVNKGHSVVGFLAVGSVESLEAFFGMTLLRYTGSLPVPLCNWNIFFWPPEMALIALQNGDAS